MKKYQQLLIVSLGVISFVCFLIYKHQYDRLRNVIEAMEVFGTPPPVIQIPMLKSEDLGANNELEGIGVKDKIKNLSPHPGEPLDNENKAVEDQEDDKDKISPLRKSRSKNSRLFGYANQV